VHFLEKLRELNALLSSTDLYASRAIADTMPSFSFKNDNVFGPLMFHADDWYVAVTTGSSSESEKIADLATLKLLLNHSRNFSGRDAMTVVIKVAIEIVI
jgi:hypothetical protein